MEQYMALKEAVLALEKDVEKAFRGTHVAQVRVRKATRDIRDMAKALSDATKTLVVVAETTVEETVTA
jgi:hypothetical protein